MSHGFVDVNYAGDILDGALYPTEGTSENYRSAPYESVPHVWSTISTASGSPATRLCLQLVLCTAVRSGEARLADWSEIDFAKGEWRIPAARTKTKKPLRQPLSAPAVEVLEQARQLSGGPSPSGYVFPSPVKRGAPLSRTTLISFLGRCALRGLTTVHGLRASFRTWASEQTDADFAVMELSLGHKVGSELWSMPTLEANSLPNGVSSWRCGLRSSLAHSPGLGVPHRHLVRCRAFPGASPRRCPALGSDFRSVASRAV